MDSGAWVLFRYNPDLAKQGKNPLILDSKEPSLDLEEYMYNELRFKALKNANPERASFLLGQAKKDVQRRYNMYKHLAEMEA